MTKTYYQLPKRSIKKLIEESANYKKFLKLYWRGDEFLYNLKRYCLWLKDIDPQEYKNSKFIMERIKKNKIFREESSREQTRKLAKIPTLFGEIRQPEKEYLLIPKVSGGTHYYIPIGFCNKDIIASGSALIVQNANNYHFGILTSLVHMAWMRIIASRLSTSYQYSTLVYNTFPWPETTFKEEEKIKLFAQEILTIRGKYQKRNLADLYDPLTMPPDLLKAHQRLDKAVLKLYGMTTTASEADIVAKLLEVYKEKSGQ